MVCFQVEGAQEMAAMAGSAPAAELREELDDPLATPDVDKYVFFPFSFCLTIS